MNKTLRIYLPLLAAVILAAASVACSSSRRAVAPSDPNMSRELAAAGKNVEELNDRQASSIARAVAKSYRPWQQVSLKGKVKLEGLPIGLNVKIYMERAQSLILSLSAPLLGEVGRVEITPDSILMVNKRGKSYCKEQTASYLARFGASITDVQDLFLGHVFMLGYGTLTQDNASQIEVSTGASDTWIFTPKVQHPDAQYGFTLHPDGRMMMAAAFTPDERYLATADYSYRDNGASDMLLSIKAGKRNFKLDLSLDEPDYEPVPLEPVTINPKWSQLSFSQWLKSLK